MHKLIDWWVVYQSLLMGCLLMHTSVTEMAAANCYKETMTQGLSSSRLSLVTWSSTSSFACCVIFQTRCSRGQSNTDICYPSRASCHMTTSFIIIMILLIHQYISPSSNPSYCISFKNKKAAKASQQRCILLVPLISST